MYQHSQALSEVYYLRNEEPWSFGYVFKKVLTFEMSDFASR
jgi:hypothetical protein